MYWASDPPLPGNPSTPAELTAKLCELRQWAGQPSLRRLRQLGGVQRTTDGNCEIDALPESTTSYVLRGERRASAAFVRSFVAACLRARRRDSDELIDQVELWHEAWLAACGHATAPPDLTSPPPKLPQPTKPVSNPAPAGAVPQQLPAVIGDFTGRAEELATLEKLVPDAEPAPAMVAVITGPAGVGKTSLAVHAAHRLADRFPDGQLFIDLHGFAVTIPPVKPTDALDRLLRVLGIPGERIPAHLDDRAGLWRSVLAGRQMLILLDNAATEEQVRPMLPGAGGCLLLVTSRCRLAALEVAHSLSLDLLAPAEAEALFSQAAGHASPELKSPAQLAEAAELCGRLPLAIRVAATRLRSHPTWGVEDLISRLRDHDRRLSELADGSGASSVAAALAVSYQQLSAEQQHLYQRLGLPPGPDIDPYATAALLDTGPEQAGRLLDQLLYANLLQEPEPGRYTCHDLVRAHASHLCATTTSPRWRLGSTTRQQRRALTRLLDHYRHTASVAMDAAYPYERDRRPRVPMARTPTPDLPDPVAATRWLDANLPNLLATASHAADHGWPEHACHLSAILHRHLLTRGHYHEAETLHELALRTGYRAGELAALIGLGRIHQMQGRLPQALAALTSVLEVARRTRNRRGQLDALIGLGHVHRQRGQNEPAREAFKHALEIARSTGDRNGELNALRGISSLHLVQGRYQPALAALSAALGIARATGNRNGELGTLVGLGHLHRRQGRLAQAAGSYQPALHLSREIGDRNWQFEALHGLGRLYYAAAQLERAVASHHQALKLVTELEQPADQARAHDGLAHAYHGARDYPQARHHWRCALDILISLGTDHTEDGEATAIAIRGRLAALDHHGAQASAGVSPQNL